MLVDFCLRLAVGMTGCLLLLSPAATARPAPGRKPLAHPSFFRTHFLIVGALACLALLFAGANADWRLLTALAAAMLLAFLGSASWSLERSPGGVTLIVLTMILLLIGLVVREADGATEGRAWMRALVGALSSSALLGTAISAMLMGHSYLIAPTMSLTPLLRLLLAFFAALLLRGILAGIGLWFWAGEHSL